MKKIALILTGLILWMPALISGKKITHFSDLVKPRDMVIEGDRIYVTEETSVYIYSSRDYKLIKKFGKAGEGPQEFLRFVSLNPHKDHLIINSFGKISFYTREGNFIREVRASGGISLLFQPLGNNFVGLNIGLEDNTRFESINLYDSDLKKIRTLIKKESDTQPTRGVIKILNSTLQYLTFRDRLYIVDGNDFVIQVYDKDAKELMTITRDYQRVKFGEPDRERIMQEIKSDPRQNQFYDTIKKMAVFPEYYPAIITLFERDDFIYVMTFRRQNNKYEFFVFDGMGNFLKQIFIPFAFQTAMNPYPFSIKDSQLYQLIENEDTEQWELHVSEIR